MNIEKTMMPIATAVEKVTAKYSRENIKELILADLEKQGIHAVGLKIWFDTDYKYVADEWGMNGHLMCEFLGATVDITGA